MAGSNQRTQMPAWTSAAEEPDWTTVLAMRQSHQLRCTGRATKPVLRDPLLKLDWRRTLNACFKTGTTASTPRTGAADQKVATWRWSSLAAGPLTGTLWATSNCSPRRCPSFPEVLSAFWHAPTTTADLPCTRHQALVDPRARPPPLEKG